MRRRADRVRWGQTITYAGGKTAKINDVKRVTSAELGPMIEITLDNGEVIRRTPGSKIEVVTKKA